MSLVIDLIGQRNRGVIGRKYIRDVNGCEDYEK